MSKNSIQTPQENPSASGGRALAFCYGPAGLFKLLDAFAVHKFGHRHGSCHRALVARQMISDVEAYACNRHASPRHRDIENFGDTSPNIPRRIVNASRVCFLVGPHVRYRHRSPPEHFFIASTSPDIGSRGTITLGKPYELRSMLSSMFSSSNCCRS